MCYGNFGGYVSPYRRSVGAGPLNQAGINARIYGTGNAKQAQTADTVEIKSEKKKNTKGDIAKKILATMGIVIATTLLAYKGHAKLQSGAAKIRPWTSETINVAGKQAEKAAHGLGDAAGGIGKALGGFFRIVAAPFEALGKVLKK